MHANSFVDVRYNSITSTQKKTQSTRQEFFKLWQNIAQKFDPCPCKMSTARLTQMDMFEKYVTCKTFKNDETIISQNDIGKSFFIILKGSVVIRKQKFKNRNIAKLFIGDFFGEASYLSSHHTRNATVIANCKKCATYILEISYDYFNDVKGEFGMKDEITFIEPINQSRIFSKEFSTTVEFDSTIDIKRLRSVPFNPKKSIDANVSATIEPWALETIDTLKQMNQQETISRKLDHSHMSILQTQTVESLINDIEKLNFMNDDQLQLFVQNLKPITIHDKNIQLQKEGTKSQYIYLLEPDTRVTVWQNDQIINIYPNSTTMKIIGFDSIRFDKLCKYTICTRDENTHMYRIPKHNFINQVLNFNLINPDSLKIKTFLNSIPIFKNANIVKLKKEAQKEKQKQRRQSNSSNVNTSMSTNTNSIDFSAQSIDTATMITTIDEFIESIAIYSKCQTFIDSEIVIDRNDTVNHLYIVKHGQIIQKDSKFKPKHMNILSPGSIFGARDLFYSKTSSYMYQVVDFADIVTIPKQIILKYIRMNVLDFELVTMGHTVHHNQNKKQQNQKQQQQTTTSNSRQTENSLHALASKQLQFLTTPSMTIQNSRKALSPINSNSISNSQTNSQTNSQSNSQCNSQSNSQSNSNCNSVSNSTTNSTTSKNSRRFSFDNVMQAAYFASKMINQLANSSQEHSINDPNYWLYGLKLDNIKSKQIIEHLPDGYVKFCLCQRSVRKPVAKSSMLEVSKNKQSKNTTRIENKPAALKIVNKVCGNLTYYTREVKALSSISSPFIPKVYQIYNESDTIAMLTDVSLGGTLGQLLSQNGRRHNLFNFDKNPIAAYNNIQFYAASIVLALQQIHSQNFIYSNLILDNIRIDKNGYIKLYNFQHCVQLNIKEDKARSKISPSAGTADRSAPEIFLQKENDESKKDSKNKKNNNNNNNNITNDEKELNQSIDYWMLGIILCELCTGINPFHGISYIHDKSLIVKAISKRIGLIIKEMKKENINIKLINFIKKCFSLNTKNRLRMKQIADHHPFFKEIDWEKLELQQIKAPYIPILKNTINDTSYLKQVEQNDGIFEITRQLLPKNGHKWDQQLRVHLMDEARL